MGFAGEKAAHICFGYAAIIHERPEGYLFLPELAQCCAHSISIETAQSELDCVVLEELPEKKIILGVLDLSTNEVETAEARRCTDTTSTAALRGGADRRCSGLRN